MLKFTEFESIWQKWGQTSLFLYFAFAALGQILFQAIM